MTTLLQMMWEFFKTGLFAVGGGLATLPFLQEIGQKTGWFTSADLADMVAVSESTPGPIGINMSTYVGFHMFSVPGALLTTLSIITPSIIVILLISRVLEKFRDSRLVKNAFYGLRPASTGLIAAACLSVMGICIFHVDTFLETRVLSDLVSVKAILLAVILLVLTNTEKLKKLHPIVFLAASAVIGVVFSFAG